MKRDYPLDLDIEKERDIEDYNHIRYVIKDISWAREKAQEIYQDYGEDVFSPLNQEEMYNQSMKWLMGFMGSICRPKF